MAAGIPTCLAHDELGGRRKLVRYRDLGYLEGATECVLGPPQVDHRGDAGHPDRHVGQPDAPWPSEGVRDDDRDLEPEPGAEAVADLACRPVGIDRQQSSDAVGNVREVDAGVGAHEAVTRLADDQVAAG